MLSMNKVMQTLTLVKDAEVSYSKTGTATARIRGYVRRTYVREGSNITSDFFTWVAFGKQAEFLGKYGKKNVKFEIVGRLVNNNYTDKEGKTVYRDELTIETLEFAERKDSASSNNVPSESYYQHAPAQHPAASAPVPTQNPAPTPQPTPQPAPQPVPTNTMQRAGGFMNIDEDDEEELPFN